MNKFSRSTIIIFLCSIVPLHTVFANSYSSIYYTITPLFGNKVPAIKVTAEIRGEITSQLSVDLPSRWASGEYVEQLKPKLVGNRAKFCNFVENKSANPRKQDVFI